MGEGWFRTFPPAQWVRAYRSAWLSDDLIAGATLASYAIPVSLAYASLAGLPPQVGIYGYVLGGLGYALLGSSRQLAVGPTSAISLMIAGTVGAMAAGDSTRYAQIASLAALTVAMLCLLAWLLRLSVLVRLISDSLLVGFKAGAGITIILTQLPGLFGVTGGGDDFVERVLTLTGQLGDAKLPVLALGATSILVLLLGERFLPGKPVGLAVVAASILLSSMLGLAAAGFAVTGHIPVGLPSLAWPALRVRDVEGIFPLAAGCLLLSYVESVSAARSLAERHGYAIDPRQEFLGLGAANLFAALGQGYPVAGGLSQSAVSDKAGARTPLTLLFASLILALCLLFLTGVLANLPKAVLAAVTFVAVYRLVDVAALYRMWRISHIDFWAALIAFAAVLLLGILQGILVAAAASVLLLLARVSTPHVAFLGRVPGTTQMYSDRARHPENERLENVVAFRPESSLLYINADQILAAVLHRLEREPETRLVVCDLSASPTIDLAGCRMFHRLYDELASRGIKLTIVGAHARLRDMLRADGVGEKVGGFSRAVTLISVLHAENEAHKASVVIEPKVVKRHVFSWPFLGRECREKAEQIPNVRR
jgi:sulfate permease, SulP family